MLSESNIVILRGLRLWRNPMRILISRSQSKRTMCHTWRLDWPRWSVNRALTVTVWALSGIFRTSKVPPTPQATARTNWRLKQVKGAARIKYWAFRALIEWPNNFIYILPYHILVVLFSQYNSFIFSCAAFFSMIAFLSLNYDNAVVLFRNDSI